MIGVPFKETLLWVIIDLEDFPKVILNNYCISHNGRGSHPYLKVNQDYFHRTLKGSPKDLVVDHVNRDTLDCRKDNLRVVTISGNNQNRVLKNLYRGVSKRGNKFIARKSIDGKEVYLGSYGTAEEAAKAYEQFIFERGM